MIYYRVRKNGSNRKVYTSSINRSVTKYGYYSYLEYNELLTESEYLKVIYSERAFPYMFEQVKVNSREIKKINDKRFA